MGARYQEGCVTRAKRKRGPDVWEYRWREDGRQRTTVLGNVQSLKNKTAATKAADHLRMKVNRLAQLSARMSFGMVAEHFKANELGEDADSRTFSTKQANLSYINNWILPKWKEMELETILAVDVERWLKPLDLEAGTKAKIRNIMSAVYSHATRYGWINFNPIKAVRQSAKRSRQPQVLSVTEVAGLLITLDLRVRLMVELAIFCGLRRSEIVGLRWKHIDLENGFADVQRNVVNQVEGHCKTEVSRKPVPLDAYVVAELRDWHRENTRTAPDDWVFASVLRRGQSVWPGAIMRYYVAPAAKKVGIAVGRGWGWHTFRHTYGTLLKGNNEDVKTVQELMRHANSKITLDTYVQAISEHKRNAHSRIVQEVLHAVTSGSASKAVN